MGKHILENIDKFDQNFYNETSKLYSDIKKDGFQPYPESLDNFQHSSKLYCPIKGNKSTALTPWSKCSARLVYTLQSSLEKWKMGMECF